LAAKILKITLIKARTQTDVFRIRSIGKKHTIQYVVVIIIDSEINKQDKGVGNMSDYRDSRPQKTSRIRHVVR
jgi:hypothetical protein